MQKELEIRLEKLESLRKKVSAILLINSGESEKPNPNFTYLTNFTGYGFLYYDFDEPVILTAEMELSRANLSWVKARRIKKFSEITDIVKKKKIGIDKRNLDALTFEKLKKMKCVDVSGNLAEARAIKTKYEIDSIREACDATGRIYKSVRGKINSFDTESDVRKTIDKKIIDMNLSNAFPTIVATGKNIQYPHHVPTNAKLNGPVLMDFGVNVNGYCSDVTRTIGSRYERITQKAIDAALACVKPGAKASSLDIAARKVLGKQSKFFITALGHGVGLQVHEKPYVGSKSTDTLQEGMVFTVEPGIYVPNGIRIENDILVTSSGYENLTDF